MTTFLGLTVFAVGVALMLWAGSHNHIWEPFHRYFVLHAVGFFMLVAGLGIATQ